MKKLNIADWQATIEEKDNSVSIIVNRNDNSPVMDTESDVGDTNTVGYHLTTLSIEADYKAHGDAGGNSFEDEFKIGSYKITFANDEDNHLSIYCKKTCSEPEHISLTNGTEHSKECEIIIR